ncbi:MAG: hypothetical protein EX271_01605 [Acidimicrobiales bacterium]|nr:hypothetical protein [Hyphomonadaceae bacterium]RZV44507.1 MAG: hypothetical protein EX271_01605 [Acidimicrobiales bacterium]
MSEKAKKNSDRGDGNTDFAKDPLKNKIGTSLRQMYDDVVKEPIPDDFLSLLEKADSKKPK